MEDLEFLIDSLEAELPALRRLDIPGGRADRRRVLQSYMNVRDPHPLNADYVRVQDRYLSRIREEKGVVDAETLPRARLDARLSLWQGDITRLQCDAIVNAANSALLGCRLPCHSCIDNAIHTAAGLQLREACAELMDAQGYPEPTGQAKLTPGFNLPARFVLHTVGPIIYGALTQEDCDLLASCYRSCLALANEHGLRSVAFCCISTGVFRFPADRAAEIAVRTVRETLDQGGSVDHVIFDVFGDRDRALYAALLD
jgi:O-acetyl-ADP-ribose deacetylase (regulator of RNase III)